MIPSQDVKIPHALQPKDQNIKHKQYCNRLNKDLRNGPHQNKKILKKIWDKSSRKFQKVKLEFSSHWQLFILHSLVVQLVKNLPAIWETWVLSLGWEDPLEKGMATHSSILAWRIPWTVQSMGLQRVELD